MSNLKLKLFAVFSLLMLSLFVSSVVAQNLYGSDTKDILIPSDGTFTVTNDAGIIYEIQGTPGASGTVTTVLYNDDPQPSASIPTNVSLTHFVVITFNMNANEFTQATITIPYTDNDVQGIQPPFSIFKYIPFTNSYTELAATYNSEAKTFTITVTSIDDPLFAIGGAPSAPVVDNGGFSTAAWVALATSVVIIVLLVVVGVWYFRKK